jgi:hypothetical protein
MKDLAHSASLDSADKETPSKPGIKHLALILYATSGLTSPTIGATKAAMSATADGGVVKMGCRALIEFWAAAG